ncbi:ATP-binding protein [Pseudoxanthomonas mexicana]
MAAIAIGVMLLFTFTAWAFYYLWQTYWPEYPIPNTVVPTGLDLIWLAGTTACGVAFAVVVAIKLSKRILLPLNSVADSIKRVAAGDLSARADVGDRSLGEASLLAEDFNALAGQLERVTSDQVFWNAAIAHELRTPVTILRGRLQGLADGVFPAETAQFVSLLKHVEGLGRLIEDLRVVSLAESGHLDLQVVRTDFSGDILEVVEAMRSGMLGVGQRVRTELSQEPAFGDPMRVRQALMALLENARRHAIAGEVEVRFAVGSQYCELSVADEGPGISPEFQPHVFTAFRRAKEGSTGGTGLGLAVVAAIARAHGGHAECLPARAGGTAFVLRWPNNQSRQA